MLSPNIFLNEPDWDDSKYVTTLLTLMGAVTQTSSLNSITSHRRTLSDPVATTLHDFQLHVDLLRVTQKCQIFVVFFLPQKKKKNSNNKSPFN